jgi:hypothetical protein
MKNKEGFVMKKKIIQSIVCIGMLFATFSTVGVPSATAAPPAEPSLPTPANGSSGVTIFIELEWVSNESGLTHDVYFGAENPPPLYATNITGTSYRPQTRLQLNTTYYWQIVSYNGAMETNVSPVWSFVTAGDQPPFRPVVLDGPVAAGPDIELEFATVAPDPEGDQVYYQWDWGDGNISDWLGPYGFGEQTKTTHYWAENGTYDIRVRARDALGEEGGWSDLYQISISPQIRFENMKPGFLYLVFGRWDKTFGYIYSLDLLGIALVISAGGLTVNATGSNAVKSVVFEMANRMIEDDKWNTTGINTSAHSFEGDFILNNGLYYTTATAYDSEGRLIDRAVEQYVAYYEWQFNLLNQILGGE